ncbi:ferritin, mitochondrial-like [Tenrec ecaudatus]|uniref:ferritin, mitochondrial-like n=1 Tax=Tenrec ecaudatus TaxID=94439 RepID=UPI003F5925D1
MEVVPTPPLDPAYWKECENAINQEINQEFAASYTFLGMASHFNSIDVGLTNFAAYFLRMSICALEYVQNLMKVQIERGGQIHLDTLTPVEQDWSSAVHALEYCSLLKEDSLVDLMCLYVSAREQGDTMLHDFLENYLLHHLIKDILVLRDHLVKLHSLQGEPVCLAEYDLEDLDDNDQQ